MQIRLEAHADGVLLHVQAQPKARRNAISGVHDGRLKVSVTQAPERGKANAAIVALLARELGLKKSQLRVVAGETSAKKQLLVSGESRQSLAARLARCLDEASAR